MMVKNVRLSRSSVTIDGISNISADVVLRKMLNSDKYLI